MRFQFSLAACCMAVLMAFAGSGNAIAQVPNCNCPVSNDTVLTDIRICDPTFGNIPLTVTLCIQRQRIHPCPGVLQDATIYIRKICYLGVNPITAQQLYEAVECAIDPCKRNLLNFSV